VSIIGLRLIMFTILGGETRFGLAMRSAKKKLCAQDKVERVLEK
jgi:hypothetical protein